MDSCIHESLAVKALGPLFKLTKVRLRDNCSGEEPESLCFQESIKFVNGDREYGKSEYATSSGFCLIPEGVELAKEMNDLGLPLSFRNNEETKYGKTSRERKGTRKSNQQSLDDYMLDSIKGSEEESRSPASVLNTSKMLDQNDISENAVVADSCGLSNISLERGYSLSFATCNSSLSSEHEYNRKVSDLGFDDNFGCRSVPTDTGLSLDCGTSEGSCLINEDANFDWMEIKEKLDSPHLEALLGKDHDPDGQSNDVSLDVIKDSGVAAYAHFSGQANSDMINNHGTVDLGEWVVYWDDIHMRTYFYNVQTEESTWVPPSGMEHLVCGNSADDPTNIVAGLSELDNDKPASVLNTSKMLDQNDIIENGDVVDIYGLSNLSLERGDSLSFATCTSSFSSEHEYNCEVSDLRFDDSFGCRSVPMDTGLSLDCGTSEGSCLINEDANFDWMEIKEKLDSSHLEALLVRNHDPEGQSNDVSLDVIKDSGVAAYAQFSEQANSDMINHHGTVDLGEWVVYWDDIHMRTYFYNVQTEESTWVPPSGMEHLVCGNSTDDPTNIVAGLSELNNDIMDFRTSEVVQAFYDQQFANDLDNESSSDTWPLSQQLDGIAGNCLSADIVCSTSTTNNKKKIRTTKSKRKLFNSSEDLQGVIYELPPPIRKYWRQRYLLFSRFDHGIKMDEEGWFSVTPESLAKHHAVRCGHGAIVDFFTGVGGNAIQFAQRSKHVIAIDIDPIKINYARHNAAIYGVDDRIDFIKGDSFSLANKLKANTVFMSPPWGGPTYSKVEKFDIYTMLKPHDGQFLFDTGKGIAPKIVMFLPRNVDINQLAELSLSATPPWSLEVEKNFLNGRLKAVTAYFSEPSTS